MRDSHTGEAVSETSKPTGGETQAWLDLIKALAIIGILLNHFAERLFGFPEIANPRAGWPPFSLRLEQLRPLTDHGVWNIPANLFRWVGWFGEHGDTYRVFAPSRGAHEHADQLRA